MPSTDSSIDLKFEIMAHIFSIRMPDIVATVFLFILPPLVFATAAQKFLVKGLPSGAVKG